MNETNETNALKLKYFLDREIKVHLQLKNGRFYNGRVLEFIENRMVLFLDSKIGRVPLALNEIEIIEEYKKREEGG